MVELRHPLTAFMPSIAIFWNVISIISVALSSSFIAAGNGPSVVLAIAILHEKSK